MFLSSHSHHRCLSPVSLLLRINLDFSLGCCLLPLPVVVVRVFSEFELKGLTRCWLKSGWRYPWLVVAVAVAGSAGTGLWLLDWTGLGRLSGRTTQPSYYSVTSRPSPCLLAHSERSEMTVLEQDKTGPTMSDRYITPEYLAHLPTSVSPPPDSFRFYYFNFIGNIITPALL